MKQSSDNFKRHEVFTRESDQSIHMQANKPWCWSASLTLGLDRASDSCKVALTKI